MAIKRRGLTLYEVLNKGQVGRSGGARSTGSAAANGGAATNRAETTRMVPTRPGLNAPLVGVAQPLTEEQAAAELATARQATELVRQEREAAESARRERIEQRQREKDELRKAKQAAKHATRVARAESRRIEAERRAANPEAFGPRRAIPLTAATFFLLAGGAVAIGIAGYAVGRGRTGQRAELTTAAAVTDAAPGSSHRSPLGKSKSPTPEMKTAAAREAAGGPNADLEHMMQSAQAKSPSAGASANKSLALPGADGARAGATAAGATLPESLNYLQIESFRVTRERDSEQLARDVADVKKFLLERGIRTFARRKSNGFVLFAEQGFAPGREHAAAREAFRRKIESLGVDYRRAGGQYQFKGCLFVSYGVTQAGDPVQL